MAGNRFPTEHQEQAAVVEWLQYNNIVHFSCPNANNMSASNRTKAIRVASKMKKEGVVKGVSDLVILSYKKVLFLEMKRIKGSVTSDEQKEWMAKCLELGHDAIICKGADEAIEAIKTWLKEGK